MESCVIYARFSSHGQNEQSIEAQVRICKEFAESKGLKTINMYSDKARTGTNDSRPAFQKMISDAKSGAFKYIIVYMFDRFARNRRDSIMYKEMLKEKYGIRVLSALEPIAEDEGGEFYEMFLDWNAEKYSKRLSKRVKDGLDTSVANGTFCGGTLIYGYKIILEPIPGKTDKFIKKVGVVDEEAEVLKYVFEQYDKGITKKEIADNLNRKGVRIKGKQVKGRTFDKYIVNPKYTGEFYFGGRECKNMYPQIIPKDLFDRVQKRLNKNKYFAGGVATGKELYLLTGKAYCGHCGCQMFSDASTGKLGTRYHYYTCKDRRRTKTCTKRKEHRDQLELYVVESVIDFLSDKNNVAVIVNDVLNYYDKRTDETSLKAIQTKIANTKKEVDKLTDSFVNAKSKLLQDTIERKMCEFEILLNDLLFQEAQLELERGYKITKEDIEVFIEELLKGNKNEKEYQRQLIDNLVYKIYVSDDNTTVYLNIRGSQNMETIEFSEHSDKLSSINKDIVGVRTQSPLSRQERTVRTLLEIIVVAYFSFYKNVLEFILNVI
ncbi:MAG: recombinase family protein [Clostridia bacterium]|nr:recombinase family protein [Clostridia bacterium]